MKRARAKKIKMIAQPSLQSSDHIHDRKSSDLPINSVVSIAIVGDPYSKNGEKIEVIRSLRDDPLAGMLSRRQIDDAQFMAGRTWQRLHEASTIGVMRAIDPAKEAVDGGKIPDLISDRQIRAFKELRESYEALGTELSRLIFDVLAARMSITQAAMIRGFSTVRETLNIGIAFRGALETLAIHYGFAARRNCQQG